MVRKLVLLLLALMLFVACGPDGSDEQTSVTDGDERTVTVFRSPT